MQEDQGPLSLAIIEHFHGLEELRFFCENPPDNPCKEFIQCLTTHASGLKKFKYITLSSFSTPQLEQNYMDFKLDPTAIPGWVYLVKVGDGSAMVHEIFKPVPEGFSGNLEDLPTYNIQCHFEGFEEWVQA